MKKLLHNITNQFGLEIRRLDRQKNPLHYELLLAKYKSAVVATSDLYRQFILSDLPEDTSQRTELIMRLLGTDLGEALYIINYLNKSLHLDGDVCEFGIAQGATSALLANEITDPTKNLWLFDSFKGLPKPTEKDLLKDDIFNLGSIEAYEGAMSCGIDQVRSRLQEIKFDFNRARIVPGFIEETINFPNLPARVCFAYIDFDFYQPILTALNFLHKTLSVNGYIIVDDYDHFSTGAKTAVEEFLLTQNSNYSFSLPIKSAGNFCILQKIK